MPHPTPSRALGVRWALAYLLSTPLTIPKKVSRVHNGGRIPDDVGGVLLTAPSALCSSPVPAQGRQVDLCHRSHPSGIDPYCLHTPEVSGSTG